MVRACPGLFYQTQCCPLSVLGQPQSGSTRPQDQWGSAGSVMRAVGLIFDLQAAARAGARATHLEVAFVPRPVPAPCQRLGDGEKRYEPGSNACEATACESKGCRSSPLDPD